MGYDIALMPLRCHDCGAAIPFGGTFYLPDGGAKALCRACSLQHMLAAADVQQALRDAWALPDARPDPVATAGDQRTAVLCIAGRVATTAVDPERETFDTVAARLMRAIVESFRPPHAPPGPPPPQDPPS